MKAAAQTFQVFEFALPYDENPKSQVPETPNFDGVTSSVSGELRGPEFVVSSRRRSEMTAFVVVPEAAIHEDCPAFRPVRQVGRARKRTHIQPIVQPHLPDQPGDRQFRGRSAPPHSLHQCAALRVGRRLLLRHELFGRHCLRDKLAPLGQHRVQMRPDCVEETRHKAQARSLGAGQETGGRAI